MTETLSPAVAKDQAYAELGDDLDAIFDESAEETPEETPAAAAPKKKDKTPPTPEPAEEADPEEEEDTAEDTDDSADADDEDGDDAAAEAEEEKAALRNPDKFQAILDKRKAKLQKAREERDALRAELEELRASQAPAEPMVLKPTNTSPLANVQSEGDLTKAEAAWQAELDWCLENPQGGVREHGEEEREWSAAEVKARAKQAMQMLKDAIPQQRQWLKSADADKRTAAETMPFFNPKDPLHAELVAFGDRLMRERPELFYAPDRLTMTGKLFAFEKLAAGTHRMVKVNGQMKLLPVTRDSDGTGRPEKKPVTPSAKASAARTPSAPPPKQAGGRSHADRLHSDDPQEAAMAAMDDLLGD